MSKRKPKLNTPANLSAAVKIQAAVRRWIAYGELQRRRKMVSKRKNVANELLHTEKEYVNNLNVLLESFLKQALEKANAKHLETQLVTELTLCLSGVELIFKFHQDLLLQLNEKLESWSPSSELGALFLPMASYLKSYSAYVGHYETVVQLLAKRRGDKHLQNMLESLKPVAAGKGIKDYLIMPIQRIPRYQMLLQELVKATWKSHKDYDNLVLSQMKVQEVAVKLDNQSADACSIAKVVELASLFSRKDNFKLILPHRRYISDSSCVATIPDLSNNPLNLNLYLFNDIIVFTKQQKKDKITVQKIVFLNAVNIAYPTNSEESFSVSDSNQNNDDLCSFVIDNGKYEEWITNFDALKAGVKIWLPHSVETNTERTIDVSRNVAPPAPPLPPIKKKRIMGIQFTRKLAKTPSSEEVTKNVDIHRLKKNHSERREIELQSAAQRFSASQVVQGHNSAPELKGRTQSETLRSDVNVPLRDPERSRSKRRSSFDASRETDKSTEEPKLRKRKSLRLKKGKISKITKDETLQLNANIRFEDFIESS